MSENKTHDKCQFFSISTRCPNWDNDIMKQAAQDIPEYQGGKPKTLTYPPAEEVNRLCEKCEAFTLKPNLQPLEV